MAALGRAEIGFSREISVQRNQDIEILEVYYRPLSARQKTIAWLSLIPGFSFLGFCLAAWWRIPCRATRALAFAGIGCGLVFLTGPEINQPVLAASLSVVRSGLVLAGFAAMLHFLLMFPAAGPFLQHLRNVRLIYVPAFLFWVLVSYRAFFMPDALSTATYVFSGLVSAFYLLAGVIVFLRRYIRTAPEQRGPQGLHLVLWGSLLGFVPSAIGFMPAFSSVPGSQYFFLSMVIPPVFWAMAAIRCRSCLTLEA
jgi:hypothetical protein